MKETIHVKVFDEKGMYVVFESIVNPEKKFTVLKTEKYTKSKKYATITNGFGDVFIITGMYNDLEALVLFKEAMSDKLDKMGVLKDEITIYIKECNNIINDVNAKMV